MSDEESQIWPSKRTRQGLDTIKDSIPLLEAATEQLKRLREQPPIPVEISQDAAMVLISQLQLALRHPQNTGPSRDQARAFIEGLRSRIAAPGDPLDQLIAMGYDTRYDVFGPPVRVRPPGG